LVGCTTADDIFIRQNVVKRQNTLYAWLGSDPSINVSHENYSITEFGLFGLIATAAGTKFDDYRVWVGAARESHGRRWRSNADTSMYDDGMTKWLHIDGKNHGGEVVFTGHADDDYVAQVTYARNSGRDGALCWKTPVGNRCHIGAHRLETGATSEPTGWKSVPHRSPPAGNQCHIGARRLETGATQDQAPGGCHRAAPTTALVPPTRSCGRCRSSASGARTSIPPPESL